jgi:ABC-type multidrug transport system fused ATPase/permease subunit
MAGPGGGGGGMGRGGQGPGRGMSDDDAYLGKFYDGRLVKRMFKYARPYYKFMLIALVCLLLSSAVEIVKPYITKIGIDRYIVFNNRILRAYLLDKDEQINLLSQNGESLIRISPDQSHSFLSYLNLTEDIVNPKEPLSVSYVLNPFRYVFILKPYTLETQKAVRWERSGILGSVRYFLADSKTEKISEVSQKYPSLVNQSLDGRHYFLGIKSFKLMRRADIITMRSYDISGIVRIGFIYFIILIGSFIVIFAQVYLLTWVGQRIMKDMRLELFEHIEKLHLSYYDQNPVGRLVTRATNDVNTINEMFTSVAVNLFRDIFMFFGIGVAIFFMNVKLALILWATTPLIIFSTIVFRKAIRKAYRDVRTKLAEINSTLAEQFSGIKTIKLFARESENIRRFKQLNKEYFDANMRQLLVHAVFHPITAVILNIGVGLIIWFGGSDVIRTIMPLGSLIAFLSYVRMFFQPIQGFSDKFNIMQSAMASAERIVHILDTEPAILTPKNGLSKQSEGIIEFQNVWFTYSKEPEWILSDISFKVAPGEVIAIVGETGAGKTTITSLLPRFYDIQKGSIKVDGVDIRDWDLTALRLNIGIVLQDVFIFATDIKGNIRLNRTDISDERVIEAAHHVNAHTFIEKLPNGYNEIMPERGATLSTGQKQLLSFARVLAGDPRILILDEATSNIDTETEKLIQDALSRLLLNRTCLIVAHRLSTIKHADRIIVLHKGRIAEEGDHQSLLAKRGLYYNLYLLQYADQEKLNGQ